jgi:hypothetical protein
MRYCTYLTTYKGGLLPPFYIGYSTVRKVERGYRGTVSSRRYASIWKSELRGNPHLFTTKILTKHDRLAEAKEKEAYFQRCFNVAKNPMFINGHIQGDRFCCDRTGVPHTEETRARLRIARAGRTPVPKGTRLTQEHKDKISRANKGRKIPADVILKRAASRRGRKNIKKFSPESNLQRSISARALWTPDRRAEFSAKFSGELNGFFGKRHTEEAREKMSKTDRSYLRGLLWWTNGAEVMRAHECPGDGWVRGRKLHP